MSWPPVSPLCHCQGMGDRASTDRPQLSPLGASLLCLPGLVSGVLPAKECLGVPCQGGWGPLTPAEGPTQATPIATAPPQELRDQGLQSLGTLSPPVVERVTAALEQVLRWTH